MPSHSMPCCPMLYDILHYTEYCTTLHSTIQRWRWHSIIFLKKVDSTSPSHFTVLYLQLHPLLQPWWFHPYLDRLYYTALSSAMVEDASPSLSRRWTWHPQSVSICVGIGIYILALMPRLIAFTPYDSITSAFMRERESTLWFSIA